MFKREIFRYYGTEAQFIAAFISDIATRSGGRIVCTTNGIDQNTPMFVLTIDNSYNITFTRDGDKESPASGYNLTVSRGCSFSPFILIGNSAMMSSEVARAIRYNLIGSSEALLFELGGAISGMIDAPDFSIISTTDGVAAVGAAEHGQITTNGTMVTKNGTSLYVHDRILQYNPETPKMLQISRNKELYDSYTGGELAATVPGLHDCMTVPSKLHFVAGDKEYYSIDTGFADNPIAASTVLEV